MGALAGLRLKSAGQCLASDLAGDVQRVSHTSYRLCEKGQAL